MKKMFMMLLLAVSSQVFAQGAPTPLVSPGWVHRNTGAVQVLDLRPQDKDKPSDEKYIPGSVAIDTKKLRVERVIDGKKVKYMNPTAAEFQKMLQDMGVMKGVPMVLVAMAKDEGSYSDATRLYWQLKYFGETQMGILDGGFQQWKKAGLELVDTPLIRKGDWEVGAVNQALVADMKDVQRAVSEKTAYLIDARPSEHFTGREKRDYVAKAGRMPGATNIPTMDLIEKSSDGLVLKSISDEKSKGLLLSSGVKYDKPMIVYCNSGHLASTTWFVVSELHKNPNVSLYDGSMHEWALTESNPVEKD